MNNRTVKTCKGYQKPIDFIFSTEKSPLYFNVYNNDWVDGTYDKYLSISDHKAIYALIDRTIITESITRKNNNKLAVFDFDGVLHTYVKPENAKNKLENRSNWSD